MTPPPFREAMCPACGHHVAALFFDGVPRPLAALSWPASAAEAETLPRLPLETVQFEPAGKPIDDRPDDHPCR